MSILENKRVVALSAVFALAFGGLVYYGFGRTADFAAASKSLKSINEQVADYEAAEFPPTDKNAKALRAAAKTTAEAYKTLKADFDSYAAKCVGDGKVISSVDFQNEVRGAIDDLSRAAGEKNCQLGSAAADLGMATYKNAAATAEEVPYLGKAFGADDGTLPVCCPAAHSCYLPYCDVCFPEQTQCT